MATTVAPTYQNGVRAYNPNIDWYTWDLRGAYAGIRIWDNDFAIARDPWIYEKMERDPLIRQCLWDRISTVGGKAWSVVPAQDPNENDKLAARVMSQCVAELDQYGGFHAARINLARFLWYGATFGAIYGKRKPRAFGDTTARNWWVPTEIRDISKRRVRIWRRHGRIIRTLERILKPDGEIGYTSDPFPDDRVIAAVYDDQESQLGFGRGIADACYWPFMIRWKMREEGYQAARVWAQGIIHGKIDAAGVGDTTQDSEKVRDDFANAIRDMKSRGVIVTGLTDELESFDALGSGAQHLLEWDQRYADDLRMLITGAKLPTGGGGDTGSLARASEEAETSEGQYQTDSALLDDAITEGLITPVWRANAENLAELGLQDARMPRFRSESERKESYESKVARLKAAQDAGLVVTKSEAYEVTGFTEPTEDDIAAGNVLEPPAPTDSVGGGMPFEEQANPGGHPDAKPSKMQKRCPPGFWRDDNGVCQPHKPSMARFGKAWDESKHPREDDGEFAPVDEQQRTAHKQPTLTGSEKQIAWASDIMGVAHSRLDEYREAAEIIIKDQGEEARPIVEKALSRIETETDSSWWISHKILGTDLPGLTSKRAGRPRVGGVLDATDILMSIAVEEMGNMSRFGSGREPKTETPEFATDDVFVPHAVAFAECHTCGGAHFGNLDDDGFPKWIAKSLAKITEAMRTLIRIFARNILEPEQPPTTDQRHEADTGLLEAMVDAMAAGDLEGSAEVFRDMDELVAAEERERAVGVPEGAVPTPDAELTDLEPDDVGPTLVPQIPIGEAVADVVKRNPQLQPNAEAVAQAYRDGDAFAVAKSTSRNLTRKIQGNVADAIEQQGGLANVAVDQIVEEADGFTRAYAETIVRTNVNTSITEGRFRAVRSENVRKVIGAFKLVTARDVDVRQGRKRDNGENHAAADGLIAGVDDPIWKDVASPAGYG